MKNCAKILVLLFTGFVVQCSAMSISELEDFANFLKKTSQLDETLKKGTDHDFDEDEAASDHAWEDSGKFEGDLILNERQRRMIVEDVAEGLSRNGLRDSTKRWPDNEVIYYIQKEHFSGDQVQAIQNGIDDLAQASCVKFRPYRKGDRDAVVIQGSRRGCFSQVGYQGGYQVLNLSGRHPVGRGCFRHGTVVHELLHTLGFYHMQSSPDRDDYVNIVWENILQPARHNFRKYNAFSVSDFGVGYDYDSVLHYSKGAFSSNGGDTIVPKQGSAQIGQRVGLSDKDTQKLNKMYCDADNNDEGDDKVPLKSPNKKKKPKNKPFEGHGIGYHQGKTVVIKLLPTAETFNIMNKPAFPMFHYFSKTPQVLSTKEIQGFGPGRQIEAFKPYTYPEENSNQARKHVQDLNGLKITKNDDYNKNSDDEVIENDEQAKSHNENSDKSLDKENDDELSEAFKRLEKILKTHVYPSNSPDLKAFKVNNDYSEFTNPNKVPKIAYEFGPIKSKEYEDEKELSKSEYIKSLYRDSPQSLTGQKLKDGHTIESIQKVDSYYQDNSDLIKSDHKQQKQFERLEKPKEMQEPVTPPIDSSIPKEDKSSYRTSYPFKIHQIISNGSLELKTPDYAKYENLKSKHNYSNLYLPYIQEDDKPEKGEYKIFGESVPTYGNWYQRDHLKRNPVDYDRPSYTYISPDSKSEIRVYDDIPESSEYGLNHGSVYTGSFSPLTKQAYTLYGDPVPLTRNWYQLNSDKLNFPTTIR